MVYIAITNIIRYNLSMIGELIMKKIIIVFIAIVLFLSGCANSSREDDKKLTLYDSNYDGSDVFRLYETGDATYLSEDFVKFVKENHLTNLGLRPLPDMQQRIIIR